MLNFLLLINISFKSFDRPWFTQRCTCWPRSHHWPSIPHHQVSVYIGFFKKNSLIVIRQWYTYICAISVTCFTEIWRTLSRGWTPPRSSSMSWIIMRRWGVIRIESTVYMTTRDDSFYNIQFIVSPAERWLWPAGVSQNPKYLLHTEDGYPSLWIWIWISAILFSLSTVGFDLPGLFEEHNFVLDFCPFSWSDWCEEAEVLAWTWSACQVHLWHRTPDIWIDVSIKAFLIFEIIYLGCLCQCIGIRK